MLFQIRLTEIEKYKRNIIGNCDNFLARKISQINYFYILRIHCFYLI